jgi:sortase A
MKIKAFRIGLVLAGLALAAFGAWGAAAKAREVIFPPTPLPYALDALTADQPDGSSSLVPASSSDMPSAAPTLEGDALSAQATREPDPTPAAPLPPPDRITIGAIDLDAPVVEATEKTFDINKKLYKQWQVPDVFAAGWSKESGSPGGGTNIVLFGHHNVNGAVFAKLYKLQKGDSIVIYTGEKAFSYTVQQITKVKERGVSFAQMLENASWILPTPEERLTLVTCWPPYESTYRLIVVARPDPNPSGDAVQ